MEWIGSYSIIFSAFSNVGTAENLDQQKTFSEVNKKNPKVTNMFSPILLGPIPLHSFVPPLPLLLSPHLHHYCHRHTTSDATIATITPPLLALME